MPGRESYGPLSELIVAILRETGRDARWLEAELRKSGINYRVAVADSEATRNHIRLIADLIGAEAWKLFQVTGRFWNDLVETVCEAVYPNYSSKLAMTRKIAIESVAAGIQFRDQPVEKLFRSVHLGFQALIEPLPGQGISYCEIDCRCRARCEVTGRLRES